MNAPDHCTTKYSMMRQEAAWVAARQLGNFSAGQLAKALDIGVQTARRRIRIWRDAGKCELIDISSKIQLFRLIEPELIPLPESIRGDSIEAALWTAIRMMRRFAPTDLHASVAALRPSLKIEDARKYCQFLTKAGYLRCIKPASPGKREAHYQLTRNTGPFAPRPQRVQVLVDPNEGRIVWTPEVTV